MTSGSKYRWMLFLVLAAALGLRLLGAMWWQQRLGDASAYGFPDSHSYWYLGQQIAAGRPYEYGGPDFRVFRAPGYPLVLAGLFTIAGDDPPVLWARLIGAVLGTLTVGGVIWLGSVLFDARTGLIAGALAAVYPGAVGMSIFVLAEGLFCLWMVGQLVGWACAWRATDKRSEIGWAGVAGVAAAGAVLTRPSWLLFTPFVLGWLILLSKDRWRHLSIGMWMLVALCLTLSPWWARNYRVTGRFVPTTLQVGASLYDGLNPQATGASDMPFSTPFYLAQKQADAAAGCGAEGFEWRLDRRLQDAAVAWASQHPLEVVRLMGHKFMRLWNVWPNADEFRNWPLRAIVAAGFVPVFGLGCVGLWIWGRRGWPFILCGFPAAYFTCLHLIFVSSIRYREPAMLTWIVLAAPVIVCCWRWKRGGTAASGRAD
ncbi:MAG: ArnT family glycosyltransferase [Pirellulaceae bacterium]